MNSNNQFLQGLGVALITPFDNHGDVDVLGLERLVEYLIQSKVDYLVCLGTTAETPTLGDLEKELIRNIVVAVTNKRIPLVLGVGGNDTYAISEELKLVNEQDFQAILSVSPYYSKPTQKAIITHYSLLAKSSRLPIILYNVPSRTGSNILPETVKEIQQKNTNIIGIKEASGDFDQYLELLSIMPKDFLVISGDDMLATSVILAGGKGLISVLGGAYPKEMKCMVDLALKGKSKEAYQYHFKLMNLIKLIFEEGNPTGIKYLISSKIKEIDDNTRLPMLKASESLKERITKELQKL